MGFIAPIVEGHGEVDAVPLLLRRIAAELAGAHVEVNPPFRVKASTFLKFDEEFTRTILFTAGRAADRDGTVLILLDCEDDCPAKVGGDILAQARAVRADVPYVVCLAYREFETWFLYGIESLAGVNGLPTDVERPPHPENTRDAKGWLGERMPRGYKETSHQVSFVAKLDLRAACQSASFQRLVERLMPHLKVGEGDT